MTPIGQVNVGVEGNELFIEVVSPAEWFDISDTPGRILRAGAKALRELN